MNVLVFFGSRILYISKSLERESSSLGSMISLYRTSSYVSWSPWRLRLGLSWRLFCRISMTFLCLSLSGDCFNCIACNKWDLAMYGSPYTQLQHAITYVCCHFYISTTTGSATVCWGVYDHPLPLMSGRTFLKICCTYRSQKLLADSVEFFTPIEVPL